jgi:hypothetical protein
LKFYAINLLLKIAHETICKANKSTLGRAKKKFNKTVTKKIISILNHKQFISFSSGRSDIFSFQPASLSKRPIFLSAPLPRLYIA